MIGAPASVAVPVLTPGIAAASATCLYSGTPCMVAIIQTVAPVWRSGSRAPGIMPVVLESTPVLLALEARPDFTRGCTGSILLPLCVLIPWTAISLVDDDLVRGGGGDVRSFPREDGGISGHSNRPALACHGIAIRPDQTARCRPAPDRAG